MDTSQLQCMIKCDPVLHRRVNGVFAADKLPSELPQTPFGFIVNTDIHTKPGQHWCAFFSDVRGRVDFFDTYGRTPNQNSHYFQRWLKTNASSIQTNHIQIQSDNSTLCGLYCILFLRVRFSGYTYQQFLNVFNDSALDANDNYVADTALSAYTQCFSYAYDSNQMFTSLTKCF